MFEIYRGVAQFGSALALGARGCQFESGCPDHFSSKNQKTVKIFFYKSGKLK